MTGRNWEVDPIGLRAAAEFLEVRGPITIQYTAQQRTLGRHTARAGAHVIRLSTYLTEEQAARTLLHELAHAAQQERYDSRGAFMSAYKMESWARGYERNAFEVEARAASEFVDEFKNLIRRKGAVALKPWKAA